MRKTRPRTGPLLAVGALALAASLFPASAASAHDGLVNANPADGASLTADPGAVDLTFSDDLLTLSTDGFAIQVVDPEGLHYESGCVTVTGADITTPIALGDAGGYVVQWQVVSSDGHPTSGQYEFDYEPTSTDGAADGLTQAPACGEAWAGLPDGSPTPTPAPGATTAPAATSIPSSTDAAALATDSAQTPAGDLETNDTALAWPIVVLIAVLGLGVLAAIVVLAQRRMRGGGYGQP